MACAKKRHKRALVSMKLAFSRPDMRLQCLVDHCYLRVPLARIRKIAVREKKSAFFFSIFVISSGISVAVLSYGQIVPT